MIKHMITEIAAPACLPLGITSYAKDGEKRPALLAAALQHPPVHLSAQKSSRFSISGPRAHIAAEYAQHFFKHHQLPPSGVIEIELAIPAFMGLASESMLGLATAKALAQIHGLHPQDAQNLAAAINLDYTQAASVQAFDMGGVLLLDLQAAEQGKNPFVQRIEVAHPEREAWAFVFYFPFPPEGTSEDYELELQKEIVRKGMVARPADPAESEDLFSAVQEHDFQAFGQQLMKIHSFSRPALPKPEGNRSKQQEKIFMTMKQAGAVAWGQALTGYSLWCLVRGGDASRLIRHKVQQLVGFSGGRVMATIVDNRGVNVVENQGELGIGRPMNPRPGVSSSRDE